MSDPFKCKADRSGAGGNTPQDCDWPCCGCDPYADKVIAVLQERGTPTYEELGAIVARMPRTADGVTIVPGMKLYPLEPLDPEDVGQDEDYAVVEMHAKDPFSLENIEPELLPKNYSSKAAAQARSIGGYKLQKKRHRMMTPGGFAVPGMSDPESEDRLWDRYAKVMNRSRADLEAAGYLIVWI